MKQILIVDLDTVQDSLQMGEFERLMNYFIYLLQEFEKGKVIYLQRFPVNSSPLTYKVIWNFTQLKEWIQPFLQYF